MADTSDLTTEDGERTKCPICEGRIRATLEEFLDKLVLSADCEHIVTDDLDDARMAVVEDGFWVGLGETTIYCENGHTHEEMIDSARVKG